MAIVNTKTARGATLTSSIDSITKLPVPDESSGGAPIYSNVGLPPGTMLTQTLVVSASRQRITFDPPIKAMLLTLRHTSSTDVTIDDGVLVVAGAPSTLVADQWLDEANIAPRITLMVNKPDKEVYFNGALVSSIDFIGIGTSNGTTLSVGGIS